MEQHIYNEANAEAMSTPGAENTPGQMAQNFFEPAKAQVNNRTGSLGVTFEPPVLKGRTLMDLDLRITYHQSTIASDTTLFGLPNGWSFSFSYILNNSIVINGSDSYQLDRNVDSGMKNYKQKNFSLIEENYPFPSLPYTYNESTSKKYAYRLHFLDGHHQYFDSFGKLICYDDKWGNHQLFYYNKEDKNISESQLAEVVTTEGKSVTLNYTSNRIHISYPTGGQNEIDFSFTIDQSRLVKYTDPNNDLTIIGYKPGDNTSKHLISTITYPSGLITEYSYRGLKYRNGSANDQHMDVVSEVSRIFDGVTRTVTYDYKGNDNHNYLGFPDFNVINGNDPLFQSNGKGSAGRYKYSTIVNNGITETTHTYNWLHLELSSSVKTLTGETISELSTTYNGEGTADDYFPPYNQLPSQYQYPVEQKALYYNTKQETRSEKTVFEYDEAGNKTMEVLYQNNKIYKETLWEYDIEHPIEGTGYGVLKTQTIKDYMPNGVIEENNPAIITTKNELTINRKAIKISRAGAGEDTAFSPEKITTYEYDEKGSITSEQLQWANSAGKQGIDQTGYTFTYEDDQSIKNTFDSEGNKSTENYDLCSGFLLSNVDALGNEEKYTYDNLGRMITQIDPVDTITHYDYLTSENKVVTTYQNGYVTSNYYNGFGDCIKETDFPLKNGPERILEESVFNELGQLISKSGVLGENSELRYEYDDRGLMATETDAQNNILLYKYDSVAQTKQTFFNGVKTTEETFNIQEKLIQTCKYDLTGGIGEMITTKNYNALELHLETRNGKMNENWMRQSIKYDVFNNPIEKIVSGFDGEKQITEMTPDLLDNVLKSTIKSSHPKNSSTDEFNNLGQWVKEITPLGSIKEFWYDPVGNLIKSEGFQGEFIDQTFTSDNKLETKTYLENGERITYTYTYDENRDLITSIDQSNLGKIFYTYSLEGQLERLTYPDSNFLKWSYDENGFLETTEDIAGNVTRYQYDDYGRVYKVSNEELNESVIISYYSVQDGPYSGQIKQMSYSNGIDIHYTYSPFNLVSEIHMTNAANENLLSVTYAHDIATGNIKSIDYKSGKSSSLALNHDISYGYNGINQLIFDEKKNLDGNQISNTYTYDSAGNIQSKMISDTNGITSIEYTYDDDNKLITINTNGDTVVLEYDGNGNLKTDDEENRYTYNVLNQLITFTSKSGVTTEYTYYATGLRATKKVGDDPIISYYYDNEENANIVNELQAGTTASYLMNVSDRYLRFYDDGSITSTEYLLQNDKDVLMVLDSTGNILTEYSYEAYGEVESPIEDMTIKSNPFMYNKEYCDSESKLYYLRARYYSPHLMCFTSYDSIIIFNHYNFANGNPIMKIDPSGHISWDRIGAISIGVAAFGAGLAVTTLSGGLAGSVGGGLMGAGMSGALYAATTSDDDFRWKSYGNAVAVGAAAGAVGGGIGGAYTNSAYAATAGIKGAVVAGAFAGAASSATDYLVSSGIEGSKVRGIELQNEMILGGISGGITGGADKYADGQRGAKKYGAKALGKAVDKSSNYILQTPISQNEILLPHFQTFDNVIGIF